MSAFVPPCIRPPLEDTSPSIRVDVRNISPLYKCRRKNHCFRKPTEDERQEALDNAVDLLDLGAPAYAVVAHLRRRCGISRSAAYREVQDAEDIRRERGYEPQNSACESLELSHHLLVQAQLEALAEGDLKVLARLSKELREGYKAIGLAIVQSDESFSFGLQAIQAQAVRMQDD